MIYFIKQEDSNFIKIGYVSGEPMNRLQCLQVGNPITLKLIRECSGNRCAERRLHRIYGQWRIRGEWFELPLHLIDEIENKSYSVGKVMHRKSTVRLPKKYVRPDWKQIKAIFDIQSALGPDNGAGKNY